MPLRESYAIWNNKGGVGKSTITFHIAARYAQLNPNHKVLVVDLCPQANASMMLLGGGTGGESHVLNFCTRPTPNTVVGYLSTTLSGGPGAQLPPLSNFVVNVNAYNSSMPRNLMLMCGDGNLEPMAPLISAQAGMAALTPTSNPWKWVHEILRRMIEKLANEITEELVVFVDTNPSFSIYTEIAVSSVNKLIVPVNADDSSRIATSAMFTLIYGANPPHPIYGSYTYASKANLYGLTRPTVHVVVGNRLTQNVGPAAAFGAVSGATAETLYEAYKNDPSRFSASQKKIKTIDDFKAKYSVPLRDFNTAGVVAAHKGLSLDSLPSGHYDIYGVQVQINATRVSECRTAIDAVVARL